MKKITIISFVLITVIMFGCKDNSVLPLPVNKFSTTLRGSVILHNQNENSNALVYIDSLNRGVSSDSSGNYTFPFNKGDSVYTGAFKVRYFLNDYDRDSAKIMLVKGKVKLDTLDVDSEGKIKTKEMKQIVRIEGWTDKSEYRTGDYVNFTARVTNVSKRTIHISITSCGGQLSSFVFLYNDKYLSFTLGGHQDVLPSECDIDIPAGSYYEGRIRNDIFEYVQLVPDEYIVATGFFIEGRTLNRFESKFNKYVVEEWWKICRGKSPKLDWFPNKYNFSHVKIIR